LSQKSLAEEAGTSYTTPWDAEGILVLNVILAIVEPIVLRKNVHLEWMFLVVLVMLKGVSVQTVVFVIMQPASVSFLGYDGERCENQVTHMNNV